MLTSFIASWLAEARAMESRSNIAIKLDALQRLLMINTLSRLLPLYIVTEYPKSGGSWLSQMISEYLKIPFPRNARPAMTSSVMHGHMLYSPLMSNVVCLFRDGRDVMVSLYFHMLFENDKNSHQVVRKFRAEMAFDDVDDIRANLPAFMEYMHEKESKSLSPYKFTWSRFVRGWVNREVCKVKYEDLVDDCFGSMKALLSNLLNESVDEARLQEIVTKYSFENQCKRKPGQEDTHSFIRKGKPGDWQEKFSKAAAIKFNEYYGKELIQLHYVSDDSWVESLTS